MIKNFTSFLAAALLSVAASAQTVLVEFNGEESLPSGIELLSADAGQIVTSTVKIHETRMLLTAYLWVRATLPMTYTVAML